VQVLQDDHDGAVGGRPLQQHGHHLEQPPSCVVRRPGGQAELGQQPGQRLAARSGVLEGDLGAQMADEVAQRADHRAERQTVTADLDALADDDEGTGIGGLGGELADQPGLADARLAAEKHRDRLPAAGCGQGRAELAELAGATDDARAGRRKEHGFHGATGHRQGRPDGGRRCRCPPAVDLVMQGVAGRSNRSGAAGATRVS
jgi:hypothetical protein